MILHQTTMKWWSLQHATFDSLLQHHVLYTVYPVMFCDMFNCNSTIYWVIFTKEDYIYVGQDEFKKQTIHHFIMDITAWADRHFQKAVVYEHS